MSIRIVRLGSDRAKGEGTRLGTVRRPPRGVAKKDFATQNWYDAWFPVLAPTDATLKLGRSVTDARGWSVFRRRYLAEMKTPAASQALDVLAAMSRQSNFSVGCYCEDESRCHRSLLRELLLARGAKLE